MRGLAPGSPPIAHRIAEARAWIRSHAARCAIRFAGSVSFAAIAVHASSSGPGGTVSASKDCLPAPPPQAGGRFAGRAYQRSADTEPVMETIRALRRRFGIADRRALRITPEPEAEQMSLAV